MRSISRVDRPRVDLWAARVLSLLVALVVCFPVLGRGYTLVYDMVFVPDPALTDRSWGGDGSVPRAVPMDAVLALVGRALPMDLVQQALLLALVGLAVLGAWRVSPAATLPGAAASALAFGWTPYLAERLAMGHWSLLLGVALLPWILRAGLAAAGGVERRPPWALVLLAAGGAVAAPTAGVLTGALVLGLAGVLAWSWRDRLLLVASVVLVNATWALPGLLARGRLAGDPSGVAAFAVSPDTPGGSVLGGPVLGGVASLLGGGGVWNVLAHPVSRGLVAAAVLSLVVVAVGLLGWRGSRAWWPSAPGARALVLGLGLLGLAIGIASLTGGGRELLVWTTEHVPGAGIVRDAQKWVAWWLLPVSLGVGPGLERLTRSFGGGQAAFLLVCGALLPVIALPDLAGGVNGRLGRVDWPADYTRAAQTLNDAQGPGAALVLPWHSFRAWSWNDDRTVLDPWNRMLSRGTVVRDDLEVTSGVVGGEDPVAAWVGDRVAAGTLTADALRGRGIRYVVEDLTTAGRDEGALVPGLRGEILYDGELVRVTDLGEVPGERDPARRASVLVVDLAAATWVLIVMALGLRRRLAGRRARMHTR